MQIRKDRRKAQRVALQKIRIEFRDSQARDVYIAGTFNDWSPGSAPMLAMGEGRWIKELVLPPGHYEYRLVVDGRWQCDPSASAQVSNGFGEFNSVINL